MPRDKTGHFYFEWYPTIFRADTQHLTFAEDGAYRRLIDHYMETKTPLPDNDRALARIAGDGLDAWEIVKEKVRSFFKLSRNPAGYLVHGFCDDLIAQHDARIRKAQNNGMKGGRPKKLETTDNKPPGLETETQRKAEQNITEQNISKSVETNKGLVSTARDAPQGDLLGSAIQEESPPKKEKANGHTNGHAGTRLKPERVAFDFDLIAFTNIPDQLILTWGEAYPAVNIREQIRKAATWLHANPAQRKSNYEKFLVNWFSKDQDRGGARRAGGGFGNPPGPTESTEDRVKRMQQKGLV